MEEGVWRTINGVHVLIGKDGTILKGPKSLQKSDIQKRLKKQFEDKKDFSKSKVKKTLYHGTGKDFENFDSEKIGSTTGNDGLFGKGFYFTENEKLAQDYIRDANNNYAKSGYVFETKINMQKPFEWKSIKTEEEFKTFKSKMGFKDEGIYWNKSSNEIHSLTTKSAEAEFTQKLKANGYDGVIYKYDKSTSEYVVFDKEQIKVLNRKKYTREG